MSVTRVKVSDVSLPSSLATEYSMTRTVMPGMSLGSAPLRRIRREAAGSAIRDSQVPSASTSKYRQVHVGLRPPQHVHPGGEHVGEQAVGQEVPVGQQQVTGLQLWQELAGQRLLPGRQRRHPGAQHRPGPALPEPDHADLRERAGPAVVARVAELSPVLRGGRHIQAHPVHGHQPHPGHERAIPAPARPAARRPPPSAAPSPAIPAAGARRVTAAGVGCMPSDVRTRNRLAHSRPATSLFHTSP